MQLTVQAASMLVVQCAARWGRHGSGLQPGGGMPGCSKPGLAECERSLCHAQVVAVAERRGRGVEIGIEWHASKRYMATRASWHAMFRMHVLQSWA